MMLNLISIKKLLIKLNGKITKIKILKILRKSKFLDFF